MSNHDITQMFGEHIKLVYGFCFHDLFVYLQYLDLGLSLLLFFLLYELLPLTLPSNEDVIPQMDCSL